MPLKCSIPQCQSTGRVTMMHGCPRRKPEILKQWLKVLGKEHLFGDPKVHRILICDNHFSEKQKFPASRRNRTNLKYDAVPDQNLPNENLSNSQSMQASSSGDSFMNFVEVPSTGFNANKMSRLNKLTDCDQSMNDRSWVEICDEELEAEIKQELESDEESDPLLDAKSELKHGIKQEDAIEEPVKQEHLDDDGFVSTAALKNILSYADVLSQGKKSEVGKNKRKIVTNIPTDELSLTSHLDIFHVDSPCKEVKKEETEIDIMLDEDTVMFSPVKKEENLAKNMKRPFKLLDSPGQDRRKRTDSVHSTHKVAKSNKHSDVHSSKHNTDKNSSSPSSKRELEVNPDILSRRQKQIDYGKNTVGYERYRQMVPRNERTKEHPKTPPKHLKMSRRAWDGLVKNWRLKLHKWDPSGDNDDFDLESVSSEQYSLSSEVCSSYDSSSVKSDSTPSTPTQSSSRKTEDGGGIWTRNRDHKTDKSKELWPNCPQKSDKSDDEEYLECESLNENCVEACS